MSTTIAPRSKRVTSTNSSNGSSPDQAKIISKAIEAQAHRLDLLASKYPVFIYLLYSLDISEFENRVKEVRELMLENLSVFSDADVNTLERNIDKFDLPHILAVARLLGPLLENDCYSQQAASMIKKLLKHPEPEARYVALEAISFALGEVPIADSLLAKAKYILKTETSPFVIDYLESL